MGTELRLAFLGGVRITSAGVALSTFVSSKAPALLCYLAVTGRPHSRSALAGLLWSDLPEDDARRNLRVVLANLRQTFAPYLIGSRETIAFDRTSPYWLDVEQLEAALQHHTPAATEQLQAAVTLYTGDFLEGFYVRDAPLFDEWATAQRERLRQRVLHALHELATHASAQGAYAAGIDACTRVLAIDPLREDTHRQLMQLLARNGQRTAALAQYQTCCQMLSDAFGAEPDSETTTLYEQIHEGLIAPSVAADQPRTPLPMPPTPLLGRAQELAQLRDLLAQPNCHLVTLVGTGGVGKTRLALEAAAEQQAYFVDGVWVVELAALRDPALVPITIAHACGILQRGDQPIVAHLQAWLCNKHLLLYLDNFEHLLDAAPLLSTLIASNPKLKLLVSSRTPLHLRGEQEFPVSPLTIPDVHRLPTASIDWQRVLDQYAALALFVARARNVNPQFAMTDAIVPIITEICARLDGLPLAIELAAARSKLFPPAVLLARLERRLPLLTSHTRDRPPHQQTMHAAIAWSYQLLDGPQQQLFACLSVFVGGWTLATAEAVVAGMLDVDVLDGMTALVDHSLVQHAVQANGEPRFVMLETIREYAREQLEQSIIDERIKQRHVEVFVDLAEDAQELFPGPRVPEGLERLEAEHDNIRAALQFAMAQHAYELVLRLTSAVWRFWSMRGHLAEGLHWLTTIHASTDHVPTEQYLDSVYGALLLAQDQGNYAQSRVFGNELLALAYACNDERWIGIALMHVSPSIDEALDRFRALGDTGLIANALLNKGRTLMFEQDASRDALPFFEESLALCEATGDHLGMIHVRLHLGLSMMLTGDVSTAVMHDQAALQLAWAAKNWLMLAYCLDSLAGIAGLRGMLRTATQLFGIADTLHATLHAPRTAEEQAIYDEWTAAVRAQLDADTFIAWWAEGQAMNKHLEHAYALALTIT